MRAFFSLLSLIAATFGAFIAYVTYGLLCHGESYGSTMCPDGNPTTTMSAQLVVGLLGLIPPALMVYFIFFRESKRGMWISFLVGLVVWAGWAVLNDASVHGWDSDMVLVP
jgi:hypothetical protein